jgi:hypothetical protein
MFIIQTRNENQIKGREVSLEDFKNPQGRATDWVNSHHQYENLEDAKTECESLIKSGRYKADNVRIVEVVCTFESEITVKMQNRKEGAE